MLSLRELRRAAAAVESGLRRARVQQVVQPDATSLVLGLYAGRPGAPGEALPLLLCCDPRLARISRPARARSAAGPPSSLAQYLRAHLVGMRLARAEVLGEDRHLRLDFERDAERCELRLLLMGGRSNLYALDAEGRLVAALRPLAATRRDLALGGPWRDPDPPRRGEGEDRFAEVPDAELLPAIEEQLGAVASQRAEQELARRAAQALRKRADSLERRARAIDRDLEAAARAPEYRRQGELLKSVLRDVRHGADETRAVDFATGEEVRIPLEPALSPAANLERLFRRHRRATRQAAQAAGRAAEVEAQRGEIAALRAELEALVRAGNDLADFCARPPVARLMARYAPQAPPRARRPAGPHAALPARLRPRRYRSSDGLEIWVGRSDEGNDLLTTRLARGKDLFLHVEASPGSHVVLRTGGRDDPPPESLLEACELAVRFSSQPNAGGAVVHVARVKDVRKPRGAKRGLVHVLRGRRVRLRRDPGRLESVLAARIDEEAGAGGAPVKGGR